MSVKAETDKGKIYLPILLLLSHWCITYTHLVLPAPVVINPSRIHKVKNSQQIFILQSNESTLTLSFYLLFVCPFFL